MAKPNRQLFTETIELKNTMVPASGVINICGDYKYGAKPKKYEIHSTINGKTKNG
jgi:hypothetical protein